MAETQVLGWGTQTAPATRITKGTEDFTILAINATFDGSAAASSFLPCVEIVSDAGQIVARCVSDQQVAAGGSAEITFAPFLGDAGSGDIRFDTAPQSGDWLVINTTGSIGGVYGSNGIDISATKTINIQSAASMALSSSGVGVSMNGDMLVQSSGDVNLQPTHDFLAEPTHDARIDALNNVIVNGVDVNVTASDEIFLYAKTGAPYPQAYVDIDPSTNAVFISADDSGSKFARITCDSSAPQMNLVTSGAGNQIAMTCGLFSLTTTADNASVQIPAGKSFRVLNHLGAQIFRVDENGDLHGLTGKSLVFDL